MAQELEDVEAIETCVKKCIHTFERCLKSQRSEDRVKSHLPGISSLAQVRVKIGVGNAAIRFD